MKTFIALLLLLPSLAFAQGATYSDPEARTWKNYAKQSNTMTVGSAAVSPWTGAGGATLSTVADGTVPGGGTWAGVATSGGQLWQTIPTPVSTTFTTKVWAKASSGTVSFGLGPRCQSLGPPSRCTCSRSDGVACTSTPGSNQLWECSTSVTIGTTPVLIETNATCSGPATGFFVVYAPATGTVLVSGLQFSTKFRIPAVPCVTTTAARTCRAP